MYPLDGTALSEYGMPTVLEVSKIPHILLWERATFIVESLVYFTMSYCDVMGTKGRVIQNRLMGPLNYKKTRAFLHNVYFQLVCCNL